MTNKCVFKKLDMHRSSEWLGVILQKRNEQKIKFLDVQTF